MADRLFPIARNARLNALRDLIDAGTGPGVLTIYAGTVALGRLSLSHPCAADAVDGAMSFGPIAEHASALAKGRADRAVISNSAGEPIIECSVSGEDGQAAIRMNEPMVAMGGPLRVLSLTMAEPE